jgi:amino acid transporter
MTTGTVAKRFRRRMAWIVLVLSVPAGFFCFSGYAMAGSFSVAHPASEARLRMVATAYLMGVVVCLLLAVAAAVILFRSRSREDGAPHHR